MARGVREARKGASERVDFSCSMRAERPERYCWMKGSVNWGRPSSSSQSGMVGEDMVEEREPD